MATMEMRRLLFGQRFFVVELGIRVRNSSCRIPKGRFDDWSQTPLPDTFAPVLTVAT